MYERRNFMNGDLFSCDPAVVSGIHLDMPDADITLYQSFYSHTEADCLFNVLKSEIRWRQEEIIVYGLKHKVPRLSAWYGNNNLSYTYSGMTSHALPWTPALQLIKQKVEAVSNSHFNSVLINYYRSGDDGVAWHSDNEPALGVNPTIASLSFGEERPFQMKHATKQSERKTIPLKHGDFLLMKGNTQHHWLHQIPKSKRNLKERINLTFRTVL